MRDALVLLLALGLAVGCAMPVGGAALEGDASPLRLELERDDDGLVSGVRLVNDGVDELRFGRSSLGYPPNPRVFVEAQQEDGEFVGKGRWYLEATMDRVDSSSLAPGGVLSFPAGYSARSLRPGDYRVSVAVHTQGGVVRRVSRELGRTGWPLELVDEALALRRDAQSASCTGLTEGIRRRLLESADTDGLQELEAATESPEDRRQVHLEMLWRGGFVRELSEFVQSAPMEEVDDLVEFLAGGDADEQPGVKRAANLRLLESVTNLAAELPAYRTTSLARMHENWPADAAESLLRRLREGSDEGYTLSALVRLFVTTQAEFESMRPRVYAVLRRRCDGAHGEPPEQDCELALSAYDPSSCGRVGLGGMATSCGCGGAFMDGSQCDPLRERWERLLESAPAPEDYALPSRVEDISAEDSLRDLD
ncbi:MAG: hypothetical protein GXP55_03295 [Deltaproteobacteria bacterium]|nr:hypothetical protein [Deltaproteobacteria bacterium]